MQNTDSIYSKYKAVIGLEIHTQLDTKSKIYSPEAVAYGVEPNTLVSPTSLGLPGSLPVLNASCIDLAIKMGLATNCEIVPFCYFARKNYFYPDLPKGYQVSQDDTPICINGSVTIRLKDGNTKEIRIQRIHIEEDSGKSFHDQDLYDSLIDLNRAGVGLIEIVSHPDIENAEQAMAYLSEIRKLVRYIDVCDGNMEEGSLRCDANISVMLKDARQFGTRAEVKNLNSISSVGRAINYEIQRQIELIESGGVVKQETRAFDAGTGKTSSLRDKESSSDYRYFPEPDLLPLEISEAKLSALKAQMPELPEKLFQKYTTKYALPEHDATLLTEQKEFAHYFESVLENINAQNIKSVSNWMNGVVKGYLNEMAIDIKDFKIKPQTLAELINLVSDGKISLTIAKEEIFNEITSNPQASPTQIAQAKGVLLENNTDAFIPIIEQVLDDHPEQVQQYLNGKTGLLGFLVGKIMKLTAGKADPKIINPLTQEKLEKRRN